MTGTGAPSATGTLTKASGSGDSSITFSAALNTFLTWNVNPSTGDWIDINPDDGGYNTAFQETSTFALVFKNNAMYRLDTVNKSTDPQNIFNIGAVTQEATVACQGLVYFFSGTDIRQTDGGFPQQISRAAVQDIINAIPQANWGDVAAGQRSATGIIINQDETVIERKAVEDVLNYRLDNTYKLDDKSKVLRHDTLLDLAKRRLEVAGVDFRGHSRQEVVQRALTTTDYPILLGNVMRTRLRALYDLYPQTWKMISTQDNVVDFKEKTAMQFGGTVAFDEIKEMGEYKNAKLVEAKETWKIKTYGKKIGISRQAIINDELGGFNRVAVILARAAANLEADTVWNMLLANSGLGVVMADTKKVFDSAHSNVAGSAAALSETTLSAGRLAMRKQKGLDASEQLYLTPQYLIIPPDLELTAQKLLTAVLAAQTSNVNVFANSLKPIVEPRITSTTAFMLCTTQIEGIVYSYLEGEQGLYTETRYGFDVDGVETKARLDFGAGILDYRGFYRNAGA